MDTKRTNSLTFTYVEILSALFALLVLLLGWAASTEGSTLSTGITILIVKLFRYATIVIGFLLIGFGRVYDSRNALLLFSPIIYILVTSLNTYDSTIVNIIGCVITCLFLLLPYQIKSNAFELYRKFIILMSLIGIACYLSYLVSLPLPHTTVAYYEAGSSFQYINYYVSYLVSSGGMVRLCGLFNEPGYFGTFIAFILIADGLNFKKKGNWILLLAGVLTLSMAFVILVLMYYALTSYKRKWPLVALAILLAIFYVVLPKIAQSNVVISTFLSRFDLLGGTFLGDNRSTIMLDDIYDKVIKGDNRWFGYGGGYANQALTWKGTSSFKTNVVDYGIIGFILMYGSLAICAIKKAGFRLPELMFIVCFFVSVYQRPNVFSIPYYVLLFGGLAYMRKENM